MKTKRFINTDNMKEEILELIQKEFLTKQYYGDKIELSLDLKDLVEARMEQMQITEPSIYITTNAYQKINTLVKEFSSEVAWHCLVEHQEGTNIYLIYDVLVFPQEVTGTTANGIDGEYEMWLATLPDEQFDNLRCHMHSHVNMGTTPSGIDENYYNNLMTQVRDYYITMIVNKKHEYYLRFYDKANNIVYVDKELIICFEDGTPLDAWYDSIKDVVKEKTYTSSYLSKKDKDDEKESGWDRRGNPYDDYDYSGYYSGYYSQEKKITTEKRGRGSPPKKKEETKINTKSIRIQGPDNDVREFVSIDHAINFIYNQYVGTNERFNKNEMRKHLAKDRAIAYDPVLGNFDYNFLKIEGGLERAILKGDIWERLKDESK